MSTTPEDDLERDAWLRAALRHAPDADASPPAALREAILREARAAASVAAPPRSAAAAPGPSPIDAIAALWNWLARPAVAGGFASLMVATLVGMLWWGRPIDPGLDAPTTVTTAPPAAVPAPATAPLAVPAPPATTPATDKQAAAEAPRDATAGTAPAVAAARATPAPPPRAPAITRVADAATNALPPTGNEVLAAAQPRPAAAKATQADAAATVDRRDQAREPESRERMAEAPRPADVDGKRERIAAPAPAELAAATPSRPEPPALAKQPPSPARASAEAMLALQSARQSAARAPAAAGAAAPATTAAPASSEDGAAGGDLAALLQDIRRRPERWTWQRDGAAARPADAALQAWLAQAEAATRGRWQPAAAPLPGAADGRSPRELRLHEGGRLAAVLRLGPGSLSIDWPGVGAPTREAIIDAASATTLRAALDRLGE
jgi:hypothetical protein